MSPLVVLAERGFDAIIVGSGATGSAMAAYLAEGGKRVLILEAGPELPNGNFVSSTLYARRLKWNGTPVIEEGGNSVSHVFNSGYGVGGSGMHHYAVWPRLHEEDFEMKSRYRRDLGWPIQYADLAPFYDRVQQEAGISGDAAQEIWRPAGAPYPLLSTYHRRASRIRRTRSRSRSGRRRWPRAKACSRPLARRKRGPAVRGSMDIMGGTIMGRTPQDSVANSYGQFHGIRTWSLRDQDSSRPAVASSRPSQHTP